MMTRTDILEQARETGKADALELASRAQAMTGTELIAEEASVPAWNARGNYTADMIGWPVQDEGQVYKLLQAHQPGHYPGTRPKDLPALWSIQHTTDPQKAKPYLPPNGTSGMYMTGECCTDADHVWRSKIDNNIWAPTGYPAGWDDLGTVEEVTTA